MDRATAEKVLPLLMEAAAKMNQAIAVIDETGDAELKQLYVRSGAQVMGEIFIELVGPIHREFPDMVPEQLRSPNPDPSG